tara:strand:- start:316 stop:507 length:192 start_codon:yes stop_codon:yes gene_type:complete
MDDLMQIIKAKEELQEIDYAITKLEIAEEDFVDEEQYEKAQVMLMEQKRLKTRKRYLIKKLEK